jgi:hypothetical protein
MALQKIRTSKVSFVKKHFDVLILPMASQKIRTSKVSFVKKHFDVLILPMALKRITTSKVYFNAIFDVLIVVVLINSKDIFDVLISTF